MSTRITRRELMAGGLAALLGGCGRGAGRVITLHFWNGFTGPDGRTMLRLVKRFNAANPGVHVLMQRMDWATYYNKLFVAGMGHRAPEIFVLHTTALPRFALARFVRPVNDLLANPGGLDPGDFAPNVWGAGNINGHHYGIPLDIHPMGMYYNRRLFREAGVPGPPRTRAEFLDAAHRITDAANDRWGFVFTNFESNIYTVMRQYGGQFFADGDARCVMNNPQNIAAMQFCRDLIATQKVAPPPQDFDSWIGFRQGKVGMAFEGIYMLADLSKQTDLDFGGAPVPVLGDRPATWANSHNLCFRADLSGPALEAAWRFVRFLSDNSLDWAAGGQVPARNSLRNTPRFRSMPVQYQFSLQIPYASYMPAVPFNFEFATEYDTAIEKALRGSQTPREALDFAAANVDKVIAREQNTFMGREARRD